MTRWKSEKSSSRRVGWRDPRDPGIVEHDVQASEALEGEGHHRHDLVGLAHIGMSKGGLLPEIGHERLPPISVDVGDHDPGALGEKSSRPFRDRYRRILR